MLHVARAMTEHGRKSLAGLKDAAIAACARQRMSWEMRGTTDTGVEQWSLECTTGAVDAGEAAGALEM